MLVLWARGAVRMWAGNLEQRVLTDYLSDEA